MAISVGNAVQVTANMINGLGGRLANVYTLQLVDLAGQTQSKLREVIADYIDFVYIPMATALSTEVTFIDIQIYNITSQTPEGSEPWPTLTAGVSAGDLYAHGVASVVTATTGIKRSLGRKFFGGFTELAITDATFTPGFLAGIASSALNWVDSYIDATGIILLPGIVTAAPVFTFRSFDEVFVRNIPGYQRRRKPGVGE